MILSGLHSRSAEPPPGVTGADHWVAAAFMCAVKPRKTAGADVYCGTTIDQIIAQKIGRENLMPSMQLAVEDPGANSSNCGEGYSCTYTNTISWASPTSPLPMELNPQVVFERMFGDGSTAEQRAARRKRDQSILDSLRGSLNRLRGDVSAPDRARLDEYAENVREIERRLEIAMKASTVAPENLEVPVGVPQTFDEHIKLQFDLLALAFQADITRVGTLLFARDLTGRTYPESEAPTSGFHGVSHHGEDPRRIADLSKINQYHVKMLAYLVERLAKTQDGDGTLLDQSLVLYGSNMGNSNQHVHYDVPHVLVGGAERQAEGRPAPGVSDQAGADRQPAAQHPRQVRHPTGFARRQHRPAGGAVSVLCGGRLQAAQGRLKPAPTSILRPVLLAVLAVCTVIGASLGAAATSDVADAAMRGDVAAVRALAGQEGRRQRAAEATARPRCTGRCIAAMPS